MPASGPGSTPFGGHAGPVRSVAYSPDGGALASGGDDGAVQIWDVRTGRPMSKLPAHTGRVQSVAWAPDGTTLATAGDDGLIQVWQTSTWRHLHQLTASGPVHSIAYPPDDSTALATAGDDAKFRVWDLGTGRQRKLEGRAGAIWSVAYANGRTFASPHRLDGVVGIWDAVPGKNAVTIKPRQELRGHAGAVWSVACAPGGAALATAGDDGTVRIWDTATGESTRVLKEHTGPVNSVAYAPGGAALATAGCDGTVRIWDTATGTCTDVLMGHSGAVQSVAYAPDGATLATGGSHDGMMRLWDTRTGQQQRVFPGHTGPLYSVAYAPDGRSAASAGDHTVLIWNMRKREPPLPVPHPNGVQSAAYAPDGTALASGDVEGTVRIWDARTADCQTELGAAHAGTVHAVAYAPNGATFATAGQDGIIRIWEATTREQRHQFSSHSGPVYSVAYAPDGATVASGQDDGTARIWNVVTGERLETFEAGGGPVYTVAYAPGGDTLAGGGGGGTVRMWDVRTGQQRNTLTGHTDPVRSIAYAPDGATLATAGDTSIRIWSARTGAQIGGTGFGAPRRPGRPLAEVCNDAPSQRDQIAANADAETLADLIATTTTSPPLAIALIGDWGVGKSSVMLQVQQRVDYLAKMSRNNPDRSMFASNVRQVQFNAWDYSDDRLWCGLVDQLFGTLAAGLATPATVADPGAAETERAAIRRQIGQLQTKKQQLDEGLRGADDSRPPAGFLAGMSSPGYAGQIVTTAARELANEVREAPRILLSLVVLGAAAYAAWSLWGWHIGAAATAVTVAVAPAVVIGQRLRTWHGAVVRITTWLRDRLEEHRQAIDQELARLRERLALIDASARLSGFLRDRAQPHAYRGFRGLLGQVRSDLERLSSDLAAARAEWRASGTAAPPPLERIVLYIDDLDRCPPARVVEMLEAIHLMLTLDLFVVVVAVDARWLIQSLEFHYRELFSSGDGTAHKGGTGAAERTIDATLSSPVDYLDKIFQIPYVLARPPSGAMASFVRSLLPPSTTFTSADGTASPAGSGSGDAGPGDAKDGATDEAGAGGRPGHDGRPATSSASAKAPETEPDQGAERPDDHEDTHRHARQAEEPGTGIPDLRPLGLQLSQIEVDFMARLGVLMPTPRAAKRLSNLYRLVRIGIPDSDHANFIEQEDGGPYQVVQILLAVLVGSPSTAAGIFRDLLHAPRGSDIITVLDHAAGINFGNGSFRARLCTELTRISAEIPMRTSISEYQPWCWKLARYSFHTRLLADGLS